MQPVPPRIDYVQKWGLTAVGVGGLFVVLWRYVQTGSLEMPVLTTFAGLLGFQSLQNGRETP